MQDESFPTFDLCYLKLEFDLFWVTFGEVGEKERAVEVSAAKWQFDENLMPPTQTSANFSFSTKNLLLKQIQKTSQECETALTSRY